MSGSRRREVERRLRSLAKAPVPPPPRGLAERIKAEVPGELAAPRRDLEPAPRRRRLEVHRWRLAAAVVMTVSAATALWWMRPGGEGEPATNRAAPAAPSAAKQAAPTGPGVEAGPPSAPPTAKVRLRAPTPESRALPRESDQAAASRAPTPEPSPEARPSGESTALVPDEARTSPPPAGRSERRDAAAEEAKAARAEAMAPAEPAGASGGAIARPTARAGEPMAQEEGDSLALGSVEPAPTAPNDAPRPRLATPPAALAGRAMPTGPALPSEDSPSGALAAVRRALTAGRLPTRDEIDVAGLVTALAAGERIAGGPGALVADGGPPPFAAPPQVRLLRFGIAPRVGEEGASPDLAVAEVEFDPERSARVRRIGGGEIGVSGDRRRLEVTEFVAGSGLDLLYEVELRPGGAAAGGPLARLTLRDPGRPGTAGEPAAVTLDLDLDGVAAAWDDATPAFRLSALTGGLAEVLADAGSAEGAARLAEIARRARRLARGDLAGDPGADELAVLASRAAELATR